MSTLAGVQSQPPQPGQIEGVEQMAEAPRPALTDRLRDQTARIKRFMKRPEAAEMAARHSARKAPIPCLVTNKKTGEATTQPGIDAAALNQDTSEAAMWVKETSTYHQSPAYWTGKSDDGKLDPKAIRVAQDLDGGVVQPEQLFRSYKSTPHQPAAVFLKYIVHRVNHQDEYDDPHQAHKLDLEFLDLVQNGNAARRNAHLNAEDLHGWLGRNHHVINPVVAHRDAIQQDLLAGCGMNVRDIGGVPHVALARGLHSDIMTKEHALSSWADVPETGFGSHMHHAWVPVKDVWFAFPHFHHDYSNDNHENEYLVSHTAPKYEATAEDVRPSRLKSGRWWNDRYDQFTHPGVPERYSLALRKAHVAPFLDTATDDDLAGYIDQATRRGSFIAPDVLHHKNAGPKAWAAVQEANRRPFASYDYLDAAVTPREEALKHLLGSEAQKGGFEYALRNPNLTHDDITGIATTTPLTPNWEFSTGFRQMAASVLAHPSADHRTAEAMWQRSETSRTPEAPTNAFDVALAQSHLTPHNILDEMVKRVEQDQAATGWAALSWTLGKNPNITPEQSARLAEAQQRLGHGIGDLARHAPLPGSVVEHVINNVLTTDDHESRLSEVDGLKRYITENPRATEDGLLAVMNAKHLSLWAPVHKWFSERVTFGLPLPAAVQMQLVRKLSGGTRGVNGDVDYFKDVSARELAMSPHLAPEVVGALATHPHLDVRRALYHNKSVTPEMLEAAYPKGYQAEQAKEAVDDGYYESNPLEELWKYIKDRKAYAERRQREHLIRPWPQGLAKSEEMEVGLWRAKLRSWVAGLRRGHGAYLLPMETEAAHRAMLDRRLVPDWTDEVLDGQAVLAHPARPHHLERFQDLPHGHCVLQFETADKPSGISDDGRHYWTEPVSLHDAKVVTVGQGGLVKTHGPLTLPKLGLTDDRRETPILTTPEQVRTKNRAMAQHFVRNHYGAPNGVAVPGVATRIDDAAQSTNGQTALVPGVRLSYAKGNMLRRPGKNPDWDPNRHANADLATKRHEDLHMMLNRVQEKYGQQGRITLVRNLVNALPDDLRETLRTFAAARAPGSDTAIKSPLHEELLALPLNYLNNPAEREAFHNWRASQGYAHRTPEERQHWDAHMKRAHKALLAAAAVATPAWTQYIRPWLQRGQQDLGEWAARGDIFNDPNAAEWFAGKSGVQKSETAVNLLPTGLEPWEEDMGLRMLGHSPQEARTLRAARFLAGGGREPDHSAHRLAMRLYGCPRKAALYAFGIGASEANLKALDAALDIGSFEKAEKKDVAEHIKSVQPGMPEAKETADEVRRAVDARQVYPLHLNGKHAGGAMAARDPKSQMVWLLKPGSGKQSPAAGARDSKTSQSRREAAFWHIASLFGIGDIIPHADLLVVNAEEWAAIRLLGSEWNTLDEQNETEQRYGRRVLEPYRAAGELHRWAILDWMCGNPDSHGQNILCNPKGQVQLIDHGSAFAGENFDPAHDDNSFIPFYLRCWGPEDLADLEPKERLRYLPRLDHDTDAGLRAWFEAVDPAMLEAVLRRYDIDTAQAVLARFKLLRDSQGNLSDLVNRIWAGVEDDE